MATSSPPFAQAAQLASFSASPQRIGMPRRDPYQRLLHRFYEALFLVKALGQTRGHQTPIPRDVNEMQARRRRFLRNLAYICDFDKGGISCTAIGIEDANTGYNFWVASNGTVKEDVLLFLRSTINSLSLLANMTKQEKISCSVGILRHCMEFSKKRIRKERQCLRRAITQAKATLHHEDQGLKSWLDNLIQPGDFQLCNAAFGATTSEWMITIVSRARQETRRAPFAEKLTTFAIIKHYIGRLAAHIHSHRQLVEDACKLTHILDTCMVYPVECSCSVPRPVRDSHTNLDGVLNRMFKNKDPERTEVENTLRRLNHQSQNSLFTTFLRQYESATPRVHAEIQVPEHFHNKQLLFVDNDRFVGCSKPSCVCCMLYFKYHPARMVVPECHQKIWANWGPPLIEAFRKDDVESICQRDIMNKISQNLRDDAIQEILNSSVPPQWHPDSVTGITDNSTVTGYDTVNMGSDSDSSGGAPVTAL